MAIYLQCIIDNEQEKGLEFGVLTLDRRDNWAEAREQLLKIDGNEQVLKEIETALFTVSLDDCVACKAADIEAVNGVQLIHGGGMARNSGNRWMDKTIQVIN